MHYFSVWCGKGTRRFFLPICPALCLTALQRGREGLILALATKSVLIAVTLVALVLLCPTASSAGQCISVGPDCDTNGGGWSQAQFPHARVGGCDYIENIFEGLSGQLLYLLSIPDLTPACNVHDRCYYSNRGESAEVCNTRFFEAMLEVCQQNFGGVDPLSVMRLRTCATWVAELAETVHAVADREENLPRARATQRDYMEYIKKNCRYETWDPYPCPEPAPSECRQTDEGTCCRNKCVSSCTKGNSRWEWQCSRR